MGVTFYCVLQVIGEPWVAGWVQIMHRLSRRVPCFLFHTAYHRLYYTVPCFLFSVWHVQYAVCCSDIKQRLWSDLLFCFVWNSIVLTVHSIGVCSLTCFSKLKIGNTSFVTCCLPPVKVWCYHQMVLQLISPSNSTRQNCLLWTRFDLTGLPRSSLVLDFVYNNLQCMMLRVWWWEEHLACKNPLQQ